MKHYITIITSFIIAITVIVTISRTQGHCGPFVTIQNVDVSTDFPAIRVFFTINNRGASDIQEIDEDNIVLYEDGYRVNYVKLLNLSRKNDLLYLVFSIDSSKSIGRTLLSEIKISAKEIIKRSRRRDKIALYRFNDEVLMLNNFSTSRESLMRNIDKISMHGRRTLLYNSIYDAIDFLSRDGLNRKAIVVFTDGRDDGSSVTSDDVIKFARESHTPVHFVCSGSPSSMKQCGRIATLTGGRVVSLKKRNSTSTLYSGIVNSMRNQYIAQYRSIINPDGGDHHIELRLKQGTIRDRASSTFSVPLSLSLFQIPHVSVLFFALMIILMVMLITVIILLLLKYRKSHTCATEPVLQKQHVYRQNYNLSDLTTVPEDSGLKPPVITPDDPDYAYARAWLLQKDGPESGKKFPIFWDQITIGRGEYNTVVTNDQAVSIEHAKIKKVNNAFLLFDLASDNGTFLNGKKLLRPKPLYDWDEIKIGRTLFIFRGTKLS